MPQADAHEGSLRGEECQWPGMALLCRRQLLVLAWLVMLSILSYHLISHYVVTAVVIQGRSMLPTLHDGDHCILNRFSYRYRAPERREVVVIQDPGHADYAVKRIVAMPGETIWVKEGAVFINGEKQTEPYLVPGTATFSLLAPELFVVLGKDQYFVLGDNRRVSEDSRIYGAIHRDQIIGLISP
jgi:signal peptidase I